jgi:hypothetical protein
MEKQLKDFVQYYIGCRCLNTWFTSEHPMYNNEWVLDGYNEHSPKPYLLGNTETETWTDSIKPILRRLNDITIEEYVEVCKEVDSEVSEEEVRNSYPSFQKEGMNQMAVDEGDFPQALKAIHYLLKQGFDLFGLLDAGLAVDEKTLTK